MHRLSIFLAFVFLMIFAIMPVSAITPPTGIAITFVDHTGDCGQTPLTGIPGGRSGLEVQFLIDTIPVDSEGPGFTDRFQVQLHDSNGVFLGDNPTVAFFPPQPSQPFAPANAVVLVNNQEGAGNPSNAPTSRPWVLTVQDFIESQGVFVNVGTFVFDPADYDPACASLPTAGISTNTPVNVGLSTQDVQLYNATDDNGEPTLHIYDINNEGNGTLALEITQDIIAPYIGNPPTENTELLTSENGKVTLFVLDTGELQINSGPDEQGKIHVLIFDGIPPTNIYGYVIDPPMFP